MGLFRRWGCVFGWALALSCASSSPIVAPPDTPPPTPSDQPDGAAAQILHRRGHLRFIDDRDPSAGHVLEVTQAIQVLAPAGRSATELVLVLSEWEELEMLWGRVRLSEDQVFDLPPGSIATETLTDSYLMSTGARRLRVHPGRIKVGAIFEFGYRVRSSRPFDLPHWDLDGPHPIRETRLEVEVPEGVELGYGVLSGGQPVPFEASREGGSLVFEDRDVPPIRADVFGPPLVDRQTRLRLFVREAPKPDGVFRDWGAVSAWYRDRVRSLETPTAELLDEVRSHSSQHSESPVDAALFDLVRQRVRYVAVFSGLGAYVPRSAESTWRSGYGDCKDMVTLLVGLLRAFDYEAHPVLVSTRGHPTVDPTVPGLSAFDHVIVASRRSPEDPWRYSDPTDPIAEFGELDLSTSGRPALMVRAKTDLSMTPDLDLDDHQVVMRVVVGSEGPIELRADLTGHPGRLWREAARYLSSPEIRGAAFSREAGASGPGGASTRDQVALRILIAEQLLPLVSPHEIESARLEVVGRSVSLRAAIARSAVLRSDGEASRLRLSKIWHPVELLPEARDAALWLGPPYRWSEEVVLHGLELSHFDARMGQWQGPGVLVQTEVHARGDTTVLSRRLERARQVFSPEELDALREWSARASRAARSWVSLKERS